ncbi:unnamed protein product, partial [Discosporangium mesarthrocarpum]
MVNQTQDLPLRYEPGKAELTGIADPSYASESYAGRSISGYVFVMSGPVVTWSSRMQPIVALLTNEAEHITLAHSAQEATYLGDFFQEFGFQQYKTITIHEVNMGTLHLANHKTYSTKTKHIGARFHVLQDLVLDNQIILKHVST